MMSTREKHPKIHRIALVDNDPRALDSLSAVIACKVPTAYVVWTATSGDEAIERCQDANSNVSLLILDMSMEGLQGPATCRRLRLMGKHMPILGATSFSIKSYRDKLVEAGAQGLVGKENADQLAQIIMRMCNGEVMEGFEPPALANLRISREAETTPALTVREEQIISLCAEGMLDRDIAERLGISEATIRKHMQSMRTQHPNLWHPIRFAIMLIVLAWTIYGVCYEPPTDIFGVIWVAMLVTALVLSPLFLKSTSVAILVIASIGDLFTPYAHLGNSLPAQLYAYGMLAYSTNAIIVATLLIYYVVNILLIDPPDPNTNPVAMVSMYAMVLLLGRTLSWSEKTTQKSFEAAQNKNRLQELESRARIADAIHDAVTGDLSAAAFVALASLLTLPTQPQQPMPKTGVKSTNIFFPH